MTSLVIGNWSTEIHYFFKVIKFYQLLSKSLDSVTAMEDNNQGQKLKIVETHY